MKEQRTTLLYIGVALLLYMVITTITLGFSTHKLLSRTIPQSIGMGQGAQQQVAALEAEISQRLSYEISQKNDPLKLSRVITVESAAKNSTDEAAEAQNAMRLSCTIISSGKSSAIIKYKGKSWVVSVGEEIDGKRIVAIDAKKAVLDDNGTEIILYNKPAPPSEFSGSGHEDINQLQL